jgi:glycosyltransferase involved in cell wall biosynthesis
LLSEDRGVRKLTVFIPCYNEVTSIAKVIDRVRSLPIDKEIVVIDNHSTDGTREFLLSVCEADASETARVGCPVLQGDGFRAVLRERNYGKGASVRLAIAIARSEYVICQDADLEYDPADIARLLGVAETKRAAAVFGARRLPAWYRGAFSLGRSLLSAIFRSLFRSAISDVATCYKLLRLDVARSLGLVSSGFDLDFEIAAKLALAGHTVEQAPVDYRPRDHRAGKKIRYRDGVSALGLFLKYRLFPPLREPSGPLAGHVPESPCLSVDTPETIGRHAATQRALPCAVSA